MPSPGISFGDLMVFIAVVVIVAVFLLVVRTFIRRVETSGPEKPGLPGVASPMNRFLEHVCRILPTAGFSILSGLCGVGITWIALGILAATRTKSKGESLIAGSMPILVAGGAVGVLVGLLASFLVLRMDASKAQEIEERYVGAGARLHIYLLGFTACIMVLLVPLLRWLGGIVGQNADVYVDLGVVLVVVALSLAAYDRIPQRFIIPLAVIAWVFTLSIAIWFFFFGSGSS